MKAKDVIRIGRKRARAASTADSTIGLPGGAHFARHLDDQDRVLGRQRDQQDQADLDVEIVVDAEAVAAPTTGPISDSGTASSTETGASQLSYWPASTR